MAEKLYKEFDQCPICGDALLVDKRNSNLLKCDCCGFHVSIETKVNYEDAERLKVANDALRSYDFEGAEDKYNLILEDNKDDSTVYLSALFGKLLSLFGVVYIKDFNGEAIPTFSEFDPDILSIKDTEIYHLIENSKASSNDKKAFLEKIDELDSIYKKIGKELEKKPLYDFFICTKISRKTPKDPDADGLTFDSGCASNFYDFLKNMGYKVFYSDKSCNEIEYDSQILSALLRSERMLVISTSSDYLESPWVQSEWRRWINFINCGVKEKNSMVLCLPKFDTFKFELPRVLRKVQRYTSEITTINAIQRLKEESMPSKEASSPSIIEVKEEKSVKVSEETKTAQEYYELALKYDLAEDTKENKQKAFDAYKKAADLGDDVSQDIVAGYYELGYIVEKNLYEAFRYYKLSSDQGLQDAMLSLGQFYQKGYGCNKDLNEALKIFTKLKSQNYSGVDEYIKEVNAELSKEKDNTKNEISEKYIEYTEEDIYNSIQEKLTNIYNSVSDMNISDEEFLGLAKKEIKIREKDLFLAIAVWYHQKGEISNHLEYAEKYYNLSENGEAYATLGTNYLYGYDFKENKEKAVHYFTLASDKGNHRAQSNLAICYIYGDGCNIDYAKAFEYAQKASLSDEPLFSRPLAQIYEFGLGCPVNHEKALELLAKHDSPIGYYNFGHHHLSGRFGKKDKKSAVDFFKIAAQKGYDPAIKQLKKMFIFKY